MTTTGSGANAPAGEASRHRRGWALLALTVAGLAQATDVSLHNTAIAQAAGDLGLTATERAFAASVGTLALAASILTIGSLADRLGRRRLLLWCCVALILGGLVTAAAPGAAVYILGRTITGVGLAGTLALSMALVRSVAPDRVAHAMSLYFTGQVGLSLPLVVLGGGLIDVSWRLGYLVVPVVGLAALLLNRAFVAEARADHPRRYDPVGMVLIAVALVAIIWGVSDASSGWLTLRVLGAVAVGVVGLIAFLLWELRIEEPALPVRLFRDPRLAGALSADVSFNMWQAVITIQLSLLWQYVYRYDSLQVSLAQLPTTVAMVCGAFAVGRLALRGRSSQSMVLAGLVGVALATLALALVGAETPYWVFGIGLVIGGFSRMMTETAAGEFFVGMPPPDLVGATVAAKPAIGQASFALGLALSSTFLYGGIGRGVQESLSDTGLTPSQQADALGWFNGGDRPVWAQDTELYNAVITGAQVAYVDAYRATMLIFAAFFVVMAGVTAYFLWWRSRAQGDRPA